MRTLKPGFFKNEDLAALPHVARLLFAGLWCMADREGRLEDRPKRIKAEVFPYENADVGKLLRVLAETGFLTRYSVDGRSFILVNAFASHQRPHKNEQESAIPSPVGQGTTMAVPEHNHGSAMDAQSLGVRTVVRTVIPPSEGVVILEPEKSNGHGFSPRHDKTTALSDYHARAVKHWKVDANVNPSSVRSLRSFDALLLTDARDFDHTKEILAWIFRGQPGDYAPIGEFDWRPNLLSGDSVRRAWDKIDILFKKALEPADARENRN